MNNLELWWLVPTMAEVIGLALGLGVLGFAYERSTREGMSLLKVLEQLSMTRWLTAGGVIFATGLAFSRAGWGSKMIGIMLALVLIGLGYVSSTRLSEYRGRLARKKWSKKAIGILLGEIGLGIILMLGLVWGISMGWHAYHLFRTAKELQSEQEQLTLEDMLPVIEETAGDIRAIHGGIRPLFPLFNALEGVPGVGAYLGQVEPVMTYANGLAQAGKEIISGLEPLLGGHTSEQTLPERAVQVLQSGQEHFVMAVEALGQADRVRNKIRPELMPDSVRPLFLKLDDNFDMLAAGGQLLQAAPGLLGADQAMSYLVLAQNRDELRATGGFISGIGLVTILNGNIKQFELGDAYRIDNLSMPYPAPPEALKRFMLADYWMPRDANWSPDFPSTAREAQALYTLSTGGETHGVIAFNQLAVERILEVIGPVQVPGTDEPVTMDNVVNYMRQAWAPEPEEGLSQEWWLHRKDFMQELGDVILKEVMKSSDQQRLIKLGKAIIDLLEEGQLQVYFNDPSAQVALERGGWDGAMHPGDADFLYLVDSNVGFNKVDSVIDRSLAYRVDLNDLIRPTSEVTLTYINSGTGERSCKQEISYGNGTYLDAQQRCYLDYWRVYTPAGAELATSNTQPVAADELLNGEGWPGQVESLAGEANTQAFAGLLMLPLSQSSQIKLSYSQSPGIIHSNGTNEWIYTLRVQVQAGLEGLPFLLEINLPEAAGVIVPDEGWKQVDSSVWRWQGVLSKSTSLSLAFTIK